MKRLYASIILAAAVLTAAAISPSEPIRAGRPVSSPAMKTAPAADAITGDYTIQYYDLTKITQSLYTNETTLAAGASANQVVLTIPFINVSTPYTFDIKGTYTEADGRITFVSKGQVAFGTDVTFYLYDESTNKESVVPSIYCQWNGNGFSFDPNFTIALPAEGNEFYFKAGYFSLTPLSDDPGADPMEGWTTVGTGLMMDGWLMPGFKGLDQSQYIYHVEIQSKDGEAGVYRVVDPYGPETPLASFNESKAEHGFIEFNVADPDHVYFYGSEAGFANSSLGITKFYPNNALGNLIGSFPEYDVEDIIKIFSEMDGYTSSTLKDGVVIVPSSGSPEEGYTNDANFGIQGAKFAGNGWMLNGKGKNMEARIFLPETGVAGVTVDDGAAVRYFNLQGVEVNRPEHGVYIRLQGTDARKVVL